MLLFVAAKQLMADSYDSFHHLKTWAEEIRAVYPDAGGRIWIGTIHGLMRYGDFPVDGHRESYDYYPEKFKSGVQSIQGFVDDRLLIRTLDDGKFVVYNPRANRIEDNFDELLRQWGIEFENRWSLNVKTDAEGNLWFYNEGRLTVRLVNENKTLKVVDMPEKIRIFNISKDEFCVATDASIYVYSVNGFKNKFKINNAESSNIRGLLIDGNGNIWVGGNNISLYDRRNNRWTAVRSHLLVTDMLVSRSGDVLVATNAAGILRYDSSGNELQEIRHIPYDPTSLRADNIRWIIEDADTTLWVCYNKRLISACNPRSPESSHGHIPNIKRQGFEDDIISIMQDKQGRIWFGSNDFGLFCMNPSDGTVSVPEQSEALKSTAIVDIYQDSRGRVWVGTFRNGVYCYDGGSTPRHFMPKLSVYSILEDSDGQIWFGLQGGGLRVIDGNLEKEPAHVSSKHKNWIFKLINAGKGTIYSVSSDGIIATDTKTRSSKIIEGNKSGTQAFKNHHFQSVFKDSRGLYWFVGLNFETPVEIYDPSSDTIIEIPRLKGQIMKSVIEDDSKNIWITSEQDVVHIIVNYDTASGRYVFIPSFYRFRSSDNEDAVYYNYRAAIKLDNGKLLFGSSDGYRIIDPANFPPHVPEVYTPELYIASVKVNNSYLKAGNDLNGRDVISDDIAGTREIELNHNENNLIVTVGAKDMTSSCQTDIYYRLKGRDMEWRLVRGATIELPDLAPGHYELEICSERADGNMSDNSIVFGITINSPWYASVWAWIIYILLSVGLVVFAIYYYLDRQKQKLYVAQIRTEADRQYQLNEMKLRFFTNVSHDFRTPLSLIITPLEAFMSDEANKNSVKYLKPVYKNAVRLLNLINQILDFRKIDVNGAVLNLSYGDIVSFVKDICSSFTLFAEDTGKQLIFSSKEKTVNMYFDKDKVTKIMMNLLSNSFKFTKAGTDVSVHMKITSDDICVSVADNGPGVPNDRKERIFDRFYQSESSSSDHLGSGIGLHIVKEFVTLHNGSITVSDNSPTGAVFTFSLPVIKAVDRPEESVTESLAENRASEYAPDGSVGLLLVEDNADFREFMKNQLSDEYNVFTAANGREALDLLEKHEIRIIVSDVMMDGMDGLELCRKVKSNLTTSHIPVILLTAKALAEDEMLGFECGADEYVTKPFNMPILRRRISKIIADSLRSQQKFKEKLDVNPSEVTITSLDEQFLSNAIRCVETNMASPDFSVETMSSMLGVHRTQLYKKLVNLTGKTPVEFIRLIRLKRAAQYLAKSQMFISEIAYMVGFGSPKIFSRHFKDEFGMSPRDFQNEHSGTGDRPETES